MSGLDRQRTPGLGCERKWAEGEAWAPLAAGMLSLKLRILESRARDARFALPESRQ